jgi:hypothetical protein
MRIAIRSQGLSKRRGTSACHEAVGLDFIALANQANRCKPAAPIRKRHGEMTLAESSRRRS